MDDKLLCAQVVVLSVCLLLVHIKSCCASTESTLLHVVHLNKDY